MEASIIVEGFNCSEEMHGLKYLEFIADGDSSVYYQIQQKVIYGSQVKKIECVNHAIKNLGKGLYKLKQDTSISVDGRKFLSKKVIQDIQKYSQKIISISNNDVEKMKENLSNCVPHVFEHHERCSPHICSTAGDICKSKLNDLKNSGILYHINGNNTILNSNYLVISTCIYRCG